MVSILKRMSTPAMLAITGVLAYFAGGFVAGMILADVRDANGFLEKCLLRIVNGYLMCAWSAVCGGFPLLDATGYHWGNNWPHIFVCWIVFFGVAYTFSRPPPWESRRRDHGDGS
jgi:hypothetical protein